MNDLNFLYSLNKHLEKIISGWKAYNIPAHSFSYAEIMKPYKQQADKAIKAFRRGYITENDAIRTLIDAYNDIMKGDRNDS